MSNIKQFGSRWGTVEKSRTYIQDAVDFANWVKEQKKKQELGCRTLADMSEEEILALESQYDCPVKRPGKKRRRFNQYTLVALQVNEGAGWVGMVEEQPGIKEWRATWEEALDAAQGWMETDGVGFDEEGNRLELAS
jgi:hypothetical protein